MEDLLAKFGKQRWAPYLCIGTALALVVLLGLCGAYLELDRARTSVISAVIGRWQSHAERTAGRLESALADAESGLDLTATRHVPWLRARWAQVVHQPERLYGAIVDNSGIIVTHSNPDHEGLRIPERWIIAELVEAGPNVVETDCQELTGGTTAYDIQVPISVGGTRVGTYHSGVNAAWLQSQLSAARSVVLRRWMLVIGGIVVVVSVAVLALLAITRRTAALEGELSRAELERIAAINRLITGLAHEIRNPLNAIRLNLFAVTRRLERRAEPVDDTTTQMLEASTAEVGRVEELMRELLGYVRDEPRVHEVVDLIAEIQNVVAFYEPVLAEDHICLHTDFPDEPIDVRLDRRRLRQILLNLLTNSREALGEQGHIWVTIRRHDDTAEVEVQDDGPGIPLQDREKVFEPFFSTKDAGMGLGLTLVRNYVLQFGGDVRWIKPEKGGSCIQLSFPLADPSVLARGAV
jgi:two-component system, NtrC family, sensor histidine kinase HydH